MAQLDMVDAPGIGTVATAAHWTGIPAATIHAWIRRGLLSGELVIPAGDHPAFGQTEEMRAPGVELGEVVRVAQEVGWQPSQPKPRTAEQRQHERHRRLLRRMVKTHEARQRFHHGQA